MGHDCWLPVLRIISDGATHSEEELAVTLAIPCADINLQIKTLRGLGLTVRGNPKKGFRLPYPVDLFDAPELIAGLPKWCRERIAFCEEIRCKARKAQQIITDVHHEIDREVIGKQRHE